MFEANNDFVPCSSILGLFKTNNSINTVILNENKIKQSFIELFKDKARGDRKRNFTIGVVSPQQPTRYMIYDNFSIYLNDNVILFDHIFKYPIENIEYVE